MFCMRFCSGVLHVNHESSLFFLYSTSGMGILDILGKIEKEIYPWRSARLTGHSLALKLPFYAQAFDSHCFWNCRYLCATNAIHYWFPRRSITRLHSGSLRRFFFPAERTHSHAERSHAKGRLRNPHKIVTGRRWPAPNTFCSSYSCSWPLLLTLCFLQ